jgi:hypothetical protein
MQLMYVVAGVQFVPGEAAGGVDQRGPELARVCVGDHSLEVRTLQGGSAADQVGVVMAIKSEAPLVGEALLGATLLGRSPLISLTLGLLTYVAARFQPSEISKIEVAAQLEGRGRAGLLAV